MQILAYVLLALLTLGQCTPGMDGVNPRVVDARDIYELHKGDSMKCRYRVAMLAEEMIQAGETFDLVFGIVNGTKHVRIEQVFNGGNCIIEPSLRSGAGFIETARWHYAPDDGASARFEGMRVVSWVSRQK